MKKLILSSQLKDLAAKCLILFAVMAFPLSVVASPKYLTCRLKGPHTSRRGYQVDYTLNQQAGTLSESRPFKTDDIPRTYPATYTPYEIVGIQDLDGILYLHRITTIDRTNGDISVETVKRPGSTPGWTIRGTCKVFKPRTQKFWINKSPTSVEPLQLRWAGSQRRINLVITKFPANLNRDLLFVVIQCVDDLRPRPARLSAITASISAA